MSWAMDRRRKPRSEHPPSIPLARLSKVARVNHHCETPLTAATWLVVAYGAIDPKRRSGKRRRGAAARPPRGSTPQGYVACLADFYKRVSGENSTDIRTFLKSANRV